MCIVYVSGSDNNNNNNEISFIVWLLLYCIFFLIRGLLLKAKNNSLIEYLYIKQRFTY